MNIKAWINSKLEGAILGNIAARLNASPRLGPIYRAGKGYLTWTSAAIGLIALFAAQVDNTGAAMIVAEVSAVGAGLGLVRKGAHMEPPQLTADMRAALSSGLSIVTWLLMAAQGVVWACAQIGASWACGVSAEAQTAGMVLMAVSGFLATYASDPPAGAR